MGAFDFDEREDDAGDYRPTRRGASGKSDTSRILYVILALVFGGIGVHNFAAGKYLRGGMQLVMLLISPLTFFLILIPLGLWILFDIITVTTDGKGRKFT
jgi:TM2 domain-containing membrane protein YozV